MWVEKSDFYLSAEVMVSFHNNVSNFNVKINDNEYSSQQIYILKQPHTSYTFGCDKII